MSPHSHRDCRWDGSESAFGGLGFSFRGSQGASGGSKGALALRRIPKPWDTLLRGSLSLHPSGLGGQHPPPVTPKSGTPQDPRCSPKSAAPPPQGPKRATGRAGMGTVTYLVQVPRQKEPPRAGRAPPSRQWGSPMGFRDLGFRGVPVSAAQGHGLAVSPRSGSSGSVAEGRKPSQCCGVEEGDGVAPSCPAGEETGFWAPHRPSGAWEPRGSGAPTLRDKDLVEPS